MKSIVATFGDDRIKTVDIYIGAVVMCDGHYWTGRGWDKNLPAAKIYKSLKGANTSIGRPSLMDQMTSAAERQGILE